MSVSVLMPFKDCVSSLSEASWRKCLEGIINQTYPKWTCILVDDCSTDKSLDIVLSYNEPRFKIIRNKHNIGLTKSLNIALASATHLYIARHDSDDFSSPERFRTQVSFLENHTDISVVGSFAKIFNSNLEEYDVQKRPTKHINIIKYMRKDNPMIHGSIMTKTADMRKMGGYDESFYVCQDYDLWQRFAAKGYKFHNLPEYLYNRISHKQSVSKKHTSLKKNAVNRVRLNYRTRNK